MWQLIRHIHSVFKAPVDNNTSKRSVFAAAVMSSFIVGTQGNDILNEGKAHIEHIYGDNGNDLVIYTPSLNKGHKDSIDGGRGLDTLWLRLTHHEANDLNLQTDLIRLHYHIYNSGHPSLVTGQGDLFRFNAFDLSLRNIEHIVIELVTPGKDTGNTKKTNAAEPNNINFPTIKDTGIDSLV